jgi:hypothetical protein
MIQKESTLDIMLLRLATEEDIPQLCPLYWEFHLFHVQGIPDWLRMPDPSQEANESN